jgi:hypothetical protein
LERILFFLIKFAFCLSLVLFAIYWTSPGISTTGDRATAVGSAPHAKQKSASRPAIAGEELLASVSREVGGELSAAVRRHCLNRPQDCLRALESLSEDAASLKKRQ